MRPLIRTLVPVAIFAIALAAGVAFAHTEGAPAAGFTFADVQLPAADGSFVNPPAPTFLEKFLGTVGGPLLDILQLALLGALGMLGKWLHAHEQTSKLAKAMAIVNDYVSNASKHLLEGIAPDVKDAIADGVISPAERAALIAKGVDLLKKELPDWVQSIMNSGFGDGLTTLLSGKVATAVDAHLAAGGAGSPK